MTDPLCLHCGEAVPADDNEPIAAWQTNEWVQAHRHRACAIRQVIGGLNHLRRRCTCCGGNEPPDPPGMSLRMAARAAVQEWIARHENANCH